MDDECNILTFMSLSKVSPYITGVCEYLMAEYPGEFERYTKRPFIHQHHIKQVVDLLLLDKNPYPLFTGARGKIKPWQICLKDLPYIAVGDNYSQKSYEEDIGIKLSNFILSTKEWQAFTIWIAYESTQRAPSVVRENVIKAKEELEKYSADEQKLDKLKIELKNAEANVEITDTLKIQPIDFSSHEEVLERMRQLFEKEELSLTQQQ